MYVFGICGSEYTVVCKNLNYTFLRPCLGPAVYRMKARDNIRGHVATGSEFNCVLDMEIMQQPINTRTANAASASAKSRSTSRRRFITR
jgi:hypothetical protein